jgi:hypothetical protein
MPKPRETKRAAPDLNPNDASVAVWFEVGPIHVLLGADLEDVGSDEKGWKAVVLSDNRPQEKASIFKVPHHGSSTGHNQEVWTNLVHANPIAVLTPWHRGSLFLPTEQDTTRINQCTNAAFVSSLPKISKKKYSSTVAKQLREMNVNVQSLHIDLGAVRLRSAPSCDAPWCVEFLGSAHPL